MKIYKLENSAFIPINVQTAWDFFSSPRNLKTITPKSMGFEIIDIHGEEMYEGQIIEYIVKPMFNIPIKWTTEITHAQKPNYFVDEQRFGPYKFWHHKHFIIEKNSGVELIDIVHYALPFGALGRIAHKLFVRKKLESIFEYRNKIIRELFAK